MSSKSFSAFSASFLLLVSSKRSSEDETCLFANDSRNCCVTTQSAFEYLIAMLLNIQFVVYLAKTPSPSPCLEMESCERGVQICSEE